MAEELEKRKPRRSTKKEEVAVAEETAAAESLESELSDEYIPENSFENTDEFTADYESDYTEDYMPDSTEESETEMDAEIEETEQNIAEGLLESVRVGNAEAEVEIPESLDLSNVEHMEMDAETLIQPEEDTPTNEQELMQTQEDEQDAIEQKINRERKKAEVDMENRQIISAGKRRKKKLYADEPVIPLEDELQYETEGTQKKREFLELVESKRAGKVLKGIVTGTSILDKRITAIVKYGEHFRVLIPYDFFVQETDADRKFFATKDEVESEYRRRFLVNQRIGSEVDFIVRGIDEVNSAVVGDRIAAMKHISDNWYFGINKRTGEYLINEGSKLEARIVFSSNVAMTVEVRGKEFRLLPEDISYRRIPDVSKEYPIGNTVPVMVTEIKRNTEGKKECAVKVSVKEVFGDPREKYIGMYKVGSLLQAIVTGIDVNGIFARIEDSKGEMDILCNYSNKENIKLPTINSTLLVRVVAKDEEKLHLYGEMVRILKEA